MVEALRAGIPAKALHVAIRIEMDDRVKESLKLAAERGIPLLETGKPELDRMTDDAIHQGLVLQIPPYEYQDAYELAEETMESWKKGHVANAPLFVALDGITDPRNLGAIIRSVSAFSGHGVIVPGAPLRRRHRLGLEDQRRRRRPRPRGTRRQPEQHAQGRSRTWASIVLGLDGDGDVSLPDLTLATEPVCIVVGSEGKGLSRLVRENCDQIVSIPIDSAMESLNASMAVGISLYEISRQRAR